MARIRKPYKYKVFAEKSISNKVGPAKFGTSKLVNRPDQWDCIANLQYQIGAESIIGCMSTQDLNSVFHYLATALGYVYQQGIAEYNPYQDYYYGSVVQYKGKIHILKKEWIEGLKEPKHCEDPNPCNPCGCPEEPVELNTNFEDESTWFTLATVEDLDAVEKKLTDMLEALKTALEKRIDELETELKTLIDTKEQELKQLIKDNYNDLVSKINSSLAQAKAYADNVSAKALSDAKTYTDNISTKALSDAKAYTDNTSAKALSDAKAYADNVSSKALSNAKTYADNVSSKALSDAKADTTAKLKALEETRATIYHTGEGLTGSGTKADLLSLNLGTDFTTDASGKLILANNALQTITSIDECGWKAGFQVFTGDSRNTVGLPVDVNSEEPTQDRNTSVSTQSYDFNGYYIASEAELNVWVSNSESTWYISNDHGVDLSTGCLKNPNEWGKWQKLDNANISTAVLNGLKASVDTHANRISSLESEVSALKERVSALENPCTVGITTVGSTTVTNDMSTIISSGGTITFPAGLTVGRQFSIIQNGDSLVTLVGASGVTLINPLNGSNILEGNNAVVTALVSATNTIRLFGQTESA